MDKIINFFNFVSIEYLNRNFEINNIIICLALSLL